MTVRLASLAALAVLVLVGGHSAALAQSDAYGWSVSYSTNGGAQVLHLSYKDSLGEGFGATCDASKSTVSIIARAKFKNQSTGSVGAVQVQAGQTILQVLSPLNLVAYDWFIAQTEIPISHPIFIALGAASEMSTYAAGQTVETWPTDQNKVREFVGTCAYNQSQWRQGGIVEGSETNPDAGNTNTGTTPTTTDGSANGGGSQTPANSDQGLSDAEALALGIIGTGAAIIANQVADEFLTEDPAPVAPNDGLGRHTSVMVSSIEAIETTFGFGGDEVFLLASNGQRFPANQNSAQSIDAGQIWSPNVDFSAQGGISIDLREYDSVSASDLIGNFAVSDSQAPGHYTATLSGGGGVYQIAYDVAFSGINVTPETRSAIPQARVWTAHNSGESITVTDCRDACEEDIGIIFMCQGPNMPAQVSVPWVATENGSAGAIAPLSIIVDGRQFTYDARLSEYGLVGHVPSIDIYAGDPVVEALQGGNTAVVLFQGAQQPIGLKGSRAALDEFKTQCSWRGSINTLAGGDAQSQFDPIWFVSSYTDHQTNRPAVSLAYGVPETDGIGFSASCVPGSGNLNIPVDLIVDIGQLPDGAQVGTYIQTTLATRQYSGQVFVSSSEWAGVRINIDATDPIWRAMQSEQTLISYGVGGGQQAKSSPVGAAQSINHFLATCAAGATSLHQDTRLGNSQSQSETQNYVCDDGSQLNVTLAAAGTVNLANVLRNGAAYALIEVPGALGKKYSNGQATLTTNSGAGQFLTAGASLFCALQ